MVYNKAWSAAVMQLQIRAVTRKVTLFGRQVIADDKELRRDLKKLNLFIIMPNSFVRLMWNIFMTVILFYTTLIVPYMITFLEEELAESRFV